jgi:hypothetical protein
MKRAEGGSDLLNSDVNRPGNVEPPMNDLDRLKEVEKKLLKTASIGSGISGALYQFSHGVFHVISTFIYPNDTEFEKRSTFITSLRLVSSFLLPLTLLKVFQVFYGITNFMLVLSLGSLIPFFHSLFSIIKIIPCPRMAALVSNSALVAAFVGLCLVGVLLYKNFWMTYIYLMSVWPWLGIATVLARLHIGRDRDVTNLSPFVHLPILAFLGAGSWLTMLYCLKSLSITDVIVLCCLDPVWTSAFHQILIGRIRFFYDHAMSLVLLTSFVFIYMYGISYSGGAVLSYYDSVQFMSQPGTIPVGTYVVFLLGRAAHVARCVYIKKSFLPPPEVSKDGKPIPYISSKYKSLFPTFPFPIRFRLDVIFDSGLVEDTPHAVGPTGTRDVFLLTQNLYLLPLSSICSWIIDQVQDGTLYDGLSPVGSTASTPGIWVVYIGIALFIFSLGIVPFAASKVLFDRGSSPHTWVGSPVIIQNVPYMVIDWLYLNPFVSRFQVVCVVILAWLLLSMRASLWNGFKRRYFKASMAELEFLQPSCLRSVQKQVLVEAANKSGVDDFGALLFETTIHHGNNIRGYLAAEGTKVWDPKPSACAAWKLAGSMVIRAIRVRKAERQTQDKIKAQDKQYMTSIVDFIVGTAQDPKRNSQFRQ